MLDHRRRQWTNMELRLAQHILFTRVTHITIAGITRAKRAENGWEEKAENRTCSPQSLPLSAPGYGGTQDGENDF